MRYSELKSSQIPELLCMSMPERDVHKLFRILKQVSELKLHPVWVLPERDVHGLSRILKRV